LDENSLTEVPEKLLTPPERSKTEPKREAPPPPRNAEASPPAAPPPGSPSEVSAPPPGAPPGSGRRRRSRRRGGRRRGGRPPETASPPPDDSAAVAPSPAPPGEAPAPAGGIAAGDALLLINTTDPEQARVALARGGVLEHLSVEVASQTSYLGNVYRARVVNVEPSIGAAFIEFGGPRNGFLHTNDVLPAYGRPDFRVTDLAKAKAGLGEGPEALQAEFDPAEDGGGKPSRSGERPPIQERLRRGQEIVVQVSKDGIGGKAPSLTTYVSLPGRFLVLMPSLPDCGVSRKISDEKERRRLLKILKELSVPAGLGFIVRTAGAGRTKKELEGDLSYLLRLWEELERRLRTSRTPSLLYEETDLVTRALRDIYFPGVRAIVVDDAAVEVRVRDFLATFAPGSKTQVRLHASPVPLFHAYGMEAEVEKTFARRVPLPSGGSIVIDPTEALVAIDVNSGRYRKESDLEETAFRTNLEAIPEIVRQMRLRDLGGQIVLDFIDMTSSKRRREVERALREALKGDRARTRIGKIGLFGLLEMTRQRLGPGLKQALYAPCSACEGTGSVRSVEATALHVVREIQAAAARRRGVTIEVSVHPDVEQYLANVKRRAVLEIEGRSHRNVLVLADRRLPMGDYRIRILGEDGKET
jgi:ribonuclease E